MSLFVLMAVASTLNFMANQKVTDKVTDYDSLAVVHQTRDGWFVTHPSFARRLPDEMKDLFPIPRRISIHYEFLKKEKVVITTETIEY
ncbi:MAG: hypothetical protein AAB897_00905 [Patescibacteria group bacterium]